MRRSTRRNSLIGSGLRALSRRWGQAGASSEWSRPVTIICPWAAGGRTDATARIVAAVLERSKNSPSTSSTAPAARAWWVIRRSPQRPDGYTLGIITVEI